MLVMDFPRLTMFTTLVFVFVFVFWTSWDTNNTNLIESQPQESVDMSADYETQGNVHLIYLDPTWPENQKPLPFKVTSRISEWSALNPSVSIKVWQNKDLLQEFPHVFGDTDIQSIQTAAWVADIARYLVIAKFGGIYVDTDIRPLRPIPASLFQKSFAVCERPRSKMPCTLVCNAVIGAGANNPVMLRAASKAINDSKDVLRQRYNDRRHDYVLDRTGPRFLTRQIFGTDFTVLSYSTFFPCDYEQRETCKNIKRSNSHAIAVHEWAKSWA